MKKILLVTAFMMGISSIGYAQEAHMKNISASSKNGVAIKNAKKENLIAEKAPITVKSVMTQTAGQPSARPARPTRRAFDNGVYYNKPDGTFYIGNKTNKYSYIMVAPLTETIFPNMCTDKASATWSINEKVYPGDENNDFNYSWVPANDGIYYAPTISVGETNYSFCESLDSKGVVATNDIYSLSYLNTGVCTTYLAWSNSYAYGPDTYTDEETGDVSYMGRVVQEYPKPEKPLYVSSIWFGYYSESKNPIPAGKEMTVVVLQYEGDEVVARYTMPLTAENVHPYESGDGTQGYMEVAYVGYDEMGLETAEGFVLDGEFVILIDGFEQEGIDFGLMLTDTSEDPYEAYFNGGSVFPTVMYYYTAEGEYAGGMWYYREDAKVQYNAPIYIDGMFNVVNVEDFENLIAPADGGEIYAIVDNENYYPQAFTTLPWTSEEGEDNYRIEGLPEWITLNEIAVPENASEDFNCYLIKMTAEALPAGAEGRQATIKIVSDLGADSGEITVTQGTVSGINVTTKTVKTSNTPAYNLAGQHVNKNFKGIVVKDGKKYIAK